jgi:hypothetical protein
MRGSKIFQLAGKVAGDAFIITVTPHWEAIITMTDLRQCPLEEDGQFGSLRAPQGLC